MIDPFDLNVPEDVATAPEVLIAFQEMLDREAHPGTIYLLHFDKPFKHAKHYVGWTADLDSRIHAHRNGRGANLLGRLKRAGIGFQVARTWSGDRNKERLIHKWGGKAKVCPICQGHES